MLRIGASAVSSSSRRLATSAAVSLLFVPTRLASSTSTPISSSSSSIPGKVRVRVRDVSGAVQESLYPCGTSLMEAIRDDPTTTADMQGSCNGTLECSTCHVYLEGKWKDVMSARLPISEREDDVLDKALGAQENSRLACQIVLSAELDGLEVAMPSTTRDARFEQFIDRTLQGQSSRKK